MRQGYSDPKRASEPHALPDVEVFYFRPTEDPIVCAEAVECESCGSMVTELSCAHETEVRTACVEPGWYWWHCFPGCLPDSDPIGPFATEAEALADAQGDDAEDAEVQTSTERERL